MKTVYILTQREKEFLAALKTKDGVKDGYNYSLDEGKFKREWQKEISELKSAFFQEVHGAYYFTYKLNPAGLTEQKKAIAALNRAKKRN